jgi:hypothetical protein
VGARRIRAELGRRGLELPTVSTIYRALVRKHLVAVQPPRPPKVLRRPEREVSLARVLALDPDSRNAPFG